MLKYSINITKRQIILVKVIATHVHFVYHVFLIYSVYCICICILALTYKIFQ